MRQRRDKKGAEGFRLTLKMESKVNESFLNHIMVLGGQRAEEALGDFLVIRRLSSGPSHIEGKPPS